MKGSVGKLWNFIIAILGAVFIIFALVLIAGGTPTAQHDCIAAQWGIVDNLRIKIGEASGKGVTIPHTFHVLDCVKCIWYNEDDEQLKVVFSVRRGYLSPEESMVKTYNISAQFVNIGCNCNDCDDKDDDTYCANLRSGEDSPYQFEIKKDRVTCVDCQPSSKPCTPCSDYTDDGKSECEKCGCYWCEECSNKMTASPEKVDTCVDSRFNCGYVCQQGVCGAECLPCPEDQDCIPVFCYCKSPPPEHI